jgi:hypothetical protein
MTHPILFLGAGASLASGMPTTTEMTREILSGEGFAHRTWARYERGAPDPGHLETSALKRSFDSYPPSSPSLSCPLTPLTRIFSTS